MSVLAERPQGPAADDGGGGLRALTTAAPGLDTLAAVVDLDPRELDAGGRVDQLVVLERVARSVAARIQDVLAVIESGTPPSGDPTTDLIAGIEDDACRAGVGAALALHPVTAAGRLDTARSLAELLPRTLAALRAGAISLTQATLIAAVVYELPMGRRADLVDAYEDKVLAKAPGQTAGETRRWAERVVLQLAPKEADERHRDAYARRGVDSWATSDAMAELRATLGADGAATAMAALNLLVNAAQAANPDDPRTTDELRADLFVEVFDAILNGTDLPTPDPAPQPDDADRDEADRDEETTAPPASRARRRGRRRARRTTITATAPDDTITGTSDEPGYLDGYGPVPATVIRRLADGATFRQGLVDPGTGELVGLGPEATTLITPTTDYGSQIYRPPTWLDRYIRSRDRTCTFPGCSRTAALCDLDHIIPFPDGPTSAANLHCLCRTHHRLKTARLWTVRRHHDGALEWTAPTGHTYTWQPPPLC